ncbi:hypothetical protein [Geothrix sp. PMB-07]|uniref:hypothetical protein n=1 Tax=Geothrix sp. PMB-07 TaxID=3068640 RepID=UPI0027421765|nr:hypothetical protein [Geothrix sp. PMB-07]WLT31002.1 hypothetical protein Q9293_14890 [Geothrix sp. PMB-07]
MSQIWRWGAGRATLPLLYPLAMAIMLWLLNRARRSFWLCALLALPGTLCHEACHWLVGKLLNGDPARFTVLPRREGHGFVLGSVALRNLRWYNAFFVGMAPLLLVPLAALLLLWRLRSQPVFGWAELGFVFLAANLLFAALPSWADVRIAARSPVGWVLLGGALAWGWMRVASPGTHAAGPGPSRLSVAPRLPPHATSKP